MTLPATAAAPKAKLPFWTYVKESYSDLLSAGPALFTAGALCLVIQLGLMLFVCDDMINVLKFAEEFEKMSPEEKKSPEFLQQVLLLLGLIGRLFLFCLAASLTLLPYRAALYRRFLHNETADFINPFAIGKKEWRLLWYQFKMLWYIALPLTVMMVLVFLSVILGYGLTLFIGTIGIIISIALTFILVIIQFFWVEGRIYTLTCAMPGIFDDPTPRMWKDIWMWGKAHRWAIFFGSACIPLEIIFFVPSQMIGQKAFSEWLFSMADNFPVQLHLAYGFLILSWLVLYVPKIAFEVRCYKFLKANKA
jgi:hypothetical protein